MPEQRAVGRSLCAAVPIAVGGSLRASGAARQVAFPLCHYGPVLLKSHVARVHSHDRRRVTSKALAHSRCSASHSPPDPSLRALWEPEEMVPGFKCNRREGIVPSV